MARRPHCPLGQGFSGIDASGQGLLLWCVVSQGLSVALKAVHISIPHCARQQIHRRKSLLTHWTYICSLSRFQQHELNGNGQFWHCCTGMHCRFVNDATLHLESWPQSGFVLPVAAMHTMLQTSLLKTHLVEGHFMPELGRLRTVWSRQSHSQR